MRGRYLRVYSFDLKTVELGPLLGAIKTQLITTYIYIMQIIILLEYFYCIYWHFKHYDWRSIFLCLVFSNFYIEIQFK